MNNINSLNVNITDAICPDFSYTGSVTILYIDERNGRPRVIKKQNNGELGLFTALSRTLAGLDSSKFMPYAIMGYCGSTMESTGEIKHGDEAFTQKIAYASSPILFHDDIQSKGDTSNSVQYTFLIPTNSLVQNVQPINSLVLFNKNTSGSEADKCASIFLESNTIQTNVASSILIYWNLKFHNA